MLRLRGLRGDRLLQALSTHFDLSETKVTANGRIRTRLYQKYGLSIREQVRLSPREDESVSGAASSSVDEESAEPAPEPSSVVKPADPHSVAVQQIAPRPSPVEAEGSPSGERDRLLQALSADFDLSETRVTANGRVQTRLYKKFGLHIQERIQLPKGDDRADPDVAKGSQEEAAFEPAGGSSNGLLNLAGAIKPADRRPAPVREIAPPASPLRSIRRSLAELRDFLSAEGSSPTIGELIQDEAAQPHQEASISPPPAVYGVLSNKRIALIGFTGRQLETTRRGFQDQFSQVTHVDWSELEPAIPLLAGHDLMIIWLEPDEDGRRLDGLESVSKPTLFAGNVESLIQLDPEYSGTPFDFVGLPLHTAEVVWRAATLLTRASVGEPAPVAEDQPEQEDRKTVRVLIAEDDPATATLLETVLSSHGMECHVVRNGEDALEMAQGKQMDASILEVGLPGLDGFQILAALRRDPDLATVPVVFLTARQSEADILRAFGLGADDYITKPFSPMEVAARLKRLLERPR